MHKFKLGDKVVYSYIRQDNDNNNTESIMEKYNNKVFTITEHLENNKYHVKNVPRVVYKNELTLVTPQDYNNKDLMSRPEPNQEPEELFSKMKEERKKPKKPVEEPELTYGETISSLKEDSKQVGGNHYSKLPIEPIDYIVKNGLGYREGNVVKYVTRHKDKNGAEDIKKAIHYLEMILDEY